MKSLKSVDEYISQAPEEVRGKLSELRSVIKAIAPDAEEKISYGMPYYGYKGRLVYFAYFKNHIGVYITPPIVANFQKELRDYETHMATIRFPYDKKFPISLIKKMIKSRMRMNEELAKKK